jgi:hypothetical protein
MTTTRIADSPSSSNGRRLPLRALAALSFLALSGLVLLAACGGNNEESTATPAGTRAPTATQAPAETPSAAATESPAAEATQTATAAPQASGGEIDPCALLTKAEVEAAIDTSVTEPEPEQSANLVACNYNDPNTPIFHLVSVTVLIGGDAAEAKDLYDLAKGNAADAQTVSGIGDDAFWDSVLNGLEVLKGKYDIRIDVSPDDLDELTAAKDLATKVVDRLP